MASVDPILKQDLLLVKEAFESGALQQNGPAIYVPFKSMVANSRQTHEIIKNNLTRYPSYYLKDNNSNSFINDIQKECIPCAARLARLKDLDLWIDFDWALDGYNKAALEGLVNFYKNLKGRTSVERNLCYMLSALRSQCVPDLRRMIAAITLIISELRNVEIKSLKDAFINVVASLLANLTVSYTTSLDRYTRLITDTLRCISNDIKNQVAKLDPILSQEGRKTMVEAFKKSWSRNAKDKYWLRNYENTRPVYNKAFFEAMDKGVSAGVAPLNFLQNAELQIHTTSRSTTGAAQAGLILEGVLNLCVGRVELKLDSALQQLLKFLKANRQNFDAMNKTMELVQTLLGLYGLIQALIDSDTRDKYDACGPEAGRRFFNNLVIPRRRISIEAPPIDSGRPPHDIDIVIEDDPIEITNPIIKDILENSGIRVRTIQNTESSSNQSVELSSKESSQAGTGIKFVVGSEPMEINFFACMKQTLG